MAKTCNKNLEMSLKKLFLKSLFDVVLILLLNNSELLTVFDVWCVWKCTMMVFCVNNCGFKDTFC